MLFRSPDGQISELLSLEDYGWQYEFHISPKIGDCKATLIYATSELPRQLKKYCDIKKVRTIRASDIAGCETDVIIIYNMGPHIETISRARHHLLVLSNQR